MANKKEIKERIKEIKKQIKYCNKRESVWCSIGSERELWALEKELKELEEELENE